MARLLMFLVIAGVLSGLRIGYAEEAKPAEMRVTLAPGHAKILVRRKYTAGDDDFRLFRSFRAPGEGVVTGLRATNASGVWVRPKILPRIEAQDLFFGKGKGPSTGEALLLERNTVHGSYAFLAYPFTSSSTRTIDYTVLVPTRYRGGRHVVAHPRVAEGDEPMTLARLGGAGKLFVDDVPLAKALRTKAMRSGDELQLAARQRGGLDGAVAFVELGPDRRVLRYRLHSATRLSRTPRSVYTVLVLDGSRSLDTRQGNGMLAAARAYLDNLPRARVEVVIFDRHAAPLFGRFVSSTHAQGILGSMVMDRANGSNVPEALSVAADRLATAPSGATKRVVLFTDALVKSTLPPASLGIEKAGGLLHVAVADESSVPLRRTDSHPWSVHAAKTGGVVWSLSPRPHVDIAEQAPALEELVRPKRVHHAKLKVPAAPELEKRIADELLEGEGFEGLAIAADVDPRVTLTGVLWTRPIRHTLHPSVPETALWERLVLSSPLASSLTKAEVRKLGLKGGVVTSETSFAFSTGGRRNFRHGFTGGRSGGTLCRMSRSIARTRAPLDEQGWLEEKLAKAHVRCGGGAIEARVRLETTRSEIVDVIVQSASGSLAKCLERASWKLATPSQFGIDEPHDTFVVKLP